MANTPKQISRAQARELIRDGDPDKLRRIRALSMN